MTAKPRDPLRYVELKVGHADDGPAWIARVRYSKSGRTLYFNGRALKPLSGQGISANYLDKETHELYWVSGVKKRGTNRHWAGAGIILVEASAVPALLDRTGARSLDPSCFQVVEDLR